MIARATLKYIRITPRKFRQIIPLVKGKNAEEAVLILMSVKKRAAEYGIALLKSALASAKRLQGVDASGLYISRLVANCGPSLKRYRAASMGRATMIRKRTSHIILELDAAKPKEGPKTIETKKVEPKKTKAAKVPAAKEDAVKKRHVKK